MTTHAIHVGAVMYPGNSTRTWSSVCLGCHWREDGWGLYDDAEQRAAQHARNPGETVPQSAPSPPDRTETQP